MWSFLRYVLYLSVTVVILDCALFLLLGGVLSYVISSLKDSGKELIDAYFARKEQYLHNIGSWPPPGSGSKNVN